MGPGVKIDPTRVRLTEEDLAEPAGAAANS
jgi:hypothetical protein